MRLILTIIASLSLSTCMLVDNFDDEPMYLEIQDISFSSDNPEIAENDNITDVWVFIDGVSRGVQPLPAIIPVLGDQDVEVALFAGIRESGQLFVANQYPFYDRLDLNIPFQPGVTIPVDFETNYVAGSMIALNDNFEGQTEFSVDFDGDLNSTIDFSSDTPFGEFAGRIDVTSDNSDFIQGTGAVFDTGNFGNREVFLEMDHNNDVGFVIGIAGISGSVGLQLPVINLFPNDDWEKLYINLGNILNLEAIEQFQVFIAGDRTGGSGTILVDNIRLLHF